MAQDEDGPRERLLGELCSALVASDTGHEKAMAALERAYNEGYAQGQQDATAGIYLEPPAPRTYEEAVNQAADDGAHSVDWPPVGKGYGQQTA